MDDFETLQEENAETYEPKAPEEATGKGALHHGERKNVGVSVLVALALGLAGALGLAFAVRISEPRELPFPTFEARSTFPELAERSRPTDEAHSPPPSRFQAALQRTTAPPEEPPPEPPPRRAVPLGDDLVGDIPSDGESWRWSIEDGVTLVLHRLPGGRPDALVYAEAFAEEMGERPTAELHRFRTTVDPEGNWGSPFLGALLRVMSGETKQGSSGNARDLDRSARIAQLLATRTLGRGLGFTAREDDFTGWRWVGRNQHRVAIRLARWAGVWSEQRPLPAELAAAVRNSPTGDGGATSPDPLARVPAYLLMGSASEPAETSGTHLAILCARTPDCPVAAELAAFLASIRTERPGLVERLLREGVQEPFRELAASAGLKIHELAGESNEPDPGG